jgi:hypothetical protein
MCVTERETLRGSEGVHTSTIARERPLVLGLVNRKHIQFEHNTLG